MVMTTMSHEALNKAVGKDLSIDDIHDSLSQLGMELKASEGDDLSVEITPDRLDLLSVHGLARALKSFLGLAKNPPRFVLKDDEKFVVNIDSENLKGVRPHTVCAVVKNLKITDDNLKEIIDVQEKLHSTLARGRTRGAIGIYPLDKITWPIKFTADLPEKISFVPLNEDKEMTGLEILELHDVGKAYAHLLAGKEKYPYFVDDAGEILSMPPIINSEKTGRVSLDTTDVFIECSGSDLSILNQMLNNLVTMFSDMGGELYSVRINYSSGESVSSPKLQPLERKLTLSHVKDRLGIDISREDIQQLLVKMMYTPVCLDHEVWTLAVPAFRADLWHEVDIIDDIARAYGFNNIGLRTPDVLSTGETLPISQLAEDLSEVMVGLGFLETYTFALTSEQEQLTNMRFDTDSTPRIRIANGQESQGMLRLSLLPQQLTSLFHNRKRPLPQKIFESSFVVLPDESTDVGARNEKHFCALIADKVVTFTQIKQVLDALLRTRGLTVTVKSSSHPSFIEGRTGEVFINDESIGFVGELHPEVLENFGLQTPVAAFEINIEKLL